MDYKVFIGPFVQCENRFIDVSNTMRTCINMRCPSHKKFKSGKFCDDCGTAIGEVSTPSRRQKVSPLQLQRNICGLCVTRNNASPMKDLPGQPTDTDLWIPTGKDAYVRLIRKRGEEQHLYFIPTQETADQEIKQFKHNCSKQLEQLCEAYGDDALTFHWGVLMFSGVA